MFFYSLLLKNIVWKHFTCIWLGFTQINSVFDTKQEDRNDMYIFYLKNEIFGAIYSFNCSKSLY